MPPDVLVNYMPLFQVWDAIIDPKIAIEHGYTSRKKVEKSSEAPSELFGSAPPLGAAPTPATLPADQAPVSAGEDELNAFMPPTTRGASEAADGKDDKDKALKSHPKTPPPPPLPATAGAKREEDPSTWSQEFDEDTEFVDAADLLDEEPTINSKGGIGGKESMV
jgi:hypothetical protein